MRSRCRVVLHVCFDAPHALEAVLIVVGAGMAADAGLPTNLPGATCSGGCRVHWSVQVPGHELMMCYGRFVSLA